MPTAPQPPSAAAPAGEAPAPITGQLTRAGTFPIRDEETTGLLISLSIDELRAIPHLPMYRRVAVVDAEALEQMQREIDYLRLLCADRDFHHAEAIRLRALAEARGGTTGRERAAGAASGALERVQAWLYQPAPTGLDPKTSIGLDIQSLVQEVLAYRRGGLTEEILRRGDGYIKVGRGCAIVAATSLQNASHEP